MRRILISKWTKAVAFFLCLTPLGVLVWNGFHGNLTANPIEKVTHETGDWTLYFLLITLSITPLRRLLQQPDLIRFRRMTGLFAFFYGCLHFLVFLWIDHSFVLSDMIMDVYQRPFITAGFTAFVLLIPLALTSTRGWIGRLGRRWQMLHRLIYVSAAAGVVHYYWLVKSDVTLPVRYGALLAFLLFCRLAFWIHDRQKRLARAAAANSRETAPAT